MFIGHFAVALAAKRAAPKISLPVLFAASQFLDILWPIFILLGVEHTRIVPGITAASPLDLHDIGYSHSLVTSLIWSALFALPLAGARRFRDSLIVAVCVFSHFVLDLIAHRPDLPLVPGGATLLGFGLWNHLAASVVVEAGLFVAGLIVYLNTTRVNAKMGSWGLGALVVFLLASWLSGVFGPPPPSIQVVVWSALTATPVVLIWVRAIDRGRSLRRV